MRLLELIVSIIGSIGVVVTASVVIIGGSDDWPLYTCLIAWVGIAWMWRLRRLPEEV